VSYSEPVIASSPDASDADDTLQDDLLVRVQGYYDGNGPGTTQTVEDDRDAVDAVAVESRSIPTGEAGLDQEASNFDEVRDLGDVIEVPIVEEELVKRPVVKEVLRIRKTQEPRTETIQGDVRKEEVEVIREGDAVIRGDTSTKIDE
jgi:stress response protein YsnF